MYECRFKSWVIRYVSESLTYFTWMCRFHLSSTYIFPPFWDEIMGQVNEEWNRNTQSSTRMWNSYKRMKEASAEGVTFYNNYVITYCQKLWRNFSQNISFHWRKEILWKILLSRNCLLRAMKWARSADTNPSTTSVQSPGQHTVIISLPDSKHVSLIEKSKVIDTFYYLTKTSVKR